MDGEIGCEIGLFLHDAIERHAWPNGYDFGESRQHIQLKIAVRLQPVPPGHHAAVPDKLGHPALVVADVEQAVVDVTGQQRPVLTVKKHGTEADVHAVGRVPQLVLFTKNTDVRHPEKTTGAVPCHERLRSLKTPVFVHMIASSEQNASVHHYPTVAGDFPFKQLSIFAFFQMNGKPNDLEAKGKLLRKGRGNRSECKKQD